MGFPTRSDTNWILQPQKMAGGLKFLYFLCSESKGTDQLWAYRAADLRLCFLYMHKAGFYGSCWILKTRDYTFSHTSVERSKNP